MTALNLAACASPILAAAMLVLVLYGPWYSIVMPPLQFATLMVEAALAATAQDTIAQMAAVTGFVVAFMSLAAIMLRDRWLEHRVKTIIDWERFEKSLASYTSGPHQ